MKPKSADGPVEGEKSPSITKVENAVRRSRGGATPDENQQSMET